VAERREGEGKRRRGKKKGQRRSKASLSSPSSYLIGSKWQSEEGKEARRDEGFFFLIFLFIYFS